MTAAQEREAVVRWLRDDAERWKGYNLPNHAHALLCAARAIEAGTHIMEKSDGETANER